MTTRTRPRRMSIALAAAFVAATTAHGLAQGESGADPLAPDPLAPTGAWSAFTGGAAQTPPMGWNSWNAFHTDVDEAKVVGAAEALVETGLAALGYRYVNIDDGWWLKRRKSDGRLLVRTAIFPSAATGGAAHSSFEPFVERIHAMGLKAGIYTDIGRNACSQAWNLTSPNLPEGDAREREVGAYGFVEQDFRLFFEEWGFDYVKVDACGVSSYAPDRPLVEEHDYRGFEPLIVGDNVNRTDIDAVRGHYARIRDALVDLNPNGDFVYSICNWGTANVRSWGKDVGNLWRTSGDIRPTWTRMLHTFDSASTRALFAGPGAWNDPDMLFIGKGDFDENHLTEARSHFALWSVINAPLLIGFDLRDAPQSLLDIWGAAEIVAVNQDPAGHQGVIAYAGDDAQIIVKTLSTRGEKAVAVFNRGHADIDVTLTAAHLKFDADAPISLRDLWAGAARDAFTNETALRVKARETLIFRASGTPLMASGAYASEIPGRVNVAVDGVVHLQHDPTVHRMVDPWGQGTRQSSRPEYAGWGGPRADATPYDETIRLGGEAYAYGIGALANSRLEIRADGEFETFRAVVGVDDTSLDKRADVVFRVYADGELVEESKPGSFDDAPQEIAADVAGAQLVELVAVSDAKAGPPLVVAWADARFD